MKGLTRERVITEVTGYEANDGTWFRTKEECEKYEGSAREAISTQFRKLMLEEPFSECCIYESFGYGSEEYMMCVIEIKNENDLKIATMYQNEIDPTSSTKFDSSMIGKRLLISLGDCYDNICYINGTMSDMCKKFKYEISRYFKTPEERKEKSDG